MSVRRVITRMYRDLLGDCFLIRIEDDKQQWQHVLIDCGLLQGLENAGDRMIAIAENIAETCKGTLDLLVVTHEHWDHISGFGQARDIFLNSDRLRIKQLWMAWTENPADATAKGLREKFDDRKFAISNLAMALKASGDDDTERLLLGQLDNFIGPVDPPASLGLAPTGRLTGARIMEELKKAAGATTYLEPGAVTVTPGEAPLRVAVLGPPRNPARLFKDAPSSGDAKETYLAEDFLEPSLLAADAGTGADPAMGLETPFAWRYSQGLSVADVTAAGAADPGTDARWLHDHYVAPDDAGEGRPQDYRRIDGEWAQNATNLALKLDSDTNNTSLVLAFELPDGSFMLFAADAQVGNWLSWHDQDYDLGPSLDAETILNRTRLYKVGHHGSHNATLRGRGLKMMTHPELVALVSTIEAVALKQGRSPPGWQMPDQDVKAALMQHCAGRVVIGDRVWTPDPGFAAQPEFARALDQSQPLFVEYTAYAAPRRRRAAKPKG